MTGELMIKVRNRRLIILLLIFILSLVTSCGTEEPGIPGTLGMEDSEEYNKTVFIIGYNFEHLNPLLVTNELNRQIFSLIYDSLYTLDDSYMHVPSLAESAVMSENAMQWDIMVRNNVYFHDNSLMTADDVAATINYLLKNDTYYNYNIRNISSVSVEGRRLRIRLKAPAQNFLSQLTFPIADAKSLTGSYGLNGTGKFKVQSFVKRKSIILIENNTHFAYRQGEINKIEVQLVPDLTTANYSFASGLADIYLQDILTQENTASSKIDTMSVEFESNHYGFLLLNHNQPLFGDKAVRQAIDLAIDRDYITSNILFSHAVPAATPISSKFYMAHKNITAKSDIERARQILFEAGYEPDPNTGILKKEENGKALLLKFTILVNNDNNFRIQVANNISDTLKTIGVEANVEIAPFDNYSARYSSGQYQALLGALPMSLDFDLSMFLKSGENMSGFSNEMLDLIIENIGKTDYEGGKADYYLRLQEYFREEIPHVSLYYTKHNLYYADKIKKGLNPISSNIFYNIEDWSYSI